jgi:ABC-type lipoprotein export system ATPase subunit
MALVETVNLKKTYLLGKVPVPALQGIDLTIEDGDCVAIVGPSGSGKSTLLNMLGALDTPSEGRVLIDGQDVAHLNENQLAELRRRVGFVFQFFNLIPRFTARENVELPLAIVGRRDRRQRSTTLLRSVGLGDRLDHTPAELSGGERQRVAIARALANEPRFLLMDEPTGNIDSRTAREIMQLITQLNVDDGITVVMVTHDERVAAQAQRTIRMLDGRIVQDLVN